MVENAKTGRMKTGLTDDEVENEWTTDCTIVKEYHLSIEGENKRKDEKEVLSFLEELVQSHYIFSYKDWDQQTLE